MAEKVFIGRIEGDIRLSLPDHDWADCFSVLSSNGFQNVNHPIALLALAEALLKLFEKLIEHAAPATLI